MHPWNPNVITPSRAALHMATPNTADLMAQGGLVLDLVLTFLVVCAQQCLL